MCFSLFNAFQALAVFLFTFGAYAGTTCGEARNSSSVGAGGKYALFINWCYKGIAESASFDDAMAERVIADTGLLSNWVVANGAAVLASAQGASQNALSAAALDDHVNDYKKVAATTPYISLGAGCVEYQGRKMPAMVVPALATALNFATRGGRTPGYIFRLWVVTTPKPAADIPGLAEDVRDLRLFSGFHKYHYQGEVTAKLYVPRRQVAWVMKVDARGDPLDASWTGGDSVIANTDFIAPHAVSNVIGSL
ncbi:hypothetical protein ACFSAG_00235 [Sphingorhabdus buctiana]|uniref:Uncharacterized protein n=1 Tax=Sphingorhabdus buctiana TaxID=1508805 RepID=A0ABW4M8A9_9SPHN